MEEDLLVYEGVQRLKRKEKKEMTTLIIVRLNLINHVLALFRDIFACNTALRNPVFRWESCKGSM